MKKRFLAVVVAVFGSLVFASAAGAVQLGITTKPTGATTGTCGAGAVFGQEASDATTPYVVPAGGGSITGWQTVTTGDVTGSSLMLVVLAPAGGGWTVVGTDVETIPNPLPASGTASFTVPHPIQVAAGDTFGLYSVSTNACYFYSSSAIPAGDTVFEAASSSAPAAGAAITPLATASPYETNLGVTLNNAQDTAVQTSVPGSSAGVYGSTVLTSVVTNNGPGAGPITFTDQVPSGLQIQSAVAGLGTCSVSGQTVTCTISGLGVGQSATVDVVVTPQKAGSFTNVAVVANASGATDPNTGNNTSTATLVVTALPQKCIVPGLKKMSAGAAKALLKQLGCKTKTVSKHSSSVAKGLVVGTSQKVGTYPYRKVITLVVSSGRKG